MKAHISSFINEFELNPLDGRGDGAFVCFSEHFRDVSWQFSGQIVSTCADVFDIFGFYLDP
jgi:hypothetical protein